MRDVMYLSQIYPITKIETPAELYYIACLAKYLDKEGIDLSLSGVDISEMNETYYYPYLVLYKNNIIDCKIEGTLPTETKYEYDFTEKEVVYKSKNPSEWVFDLVTDESYKNRRIFKCLHANKVYVNFLAYITVNRLVYGVPKKMVFDFRVADVYIQKTKNNWDICDLYLLDSYTTALDDWVDILLPSSNLAVAQLGYESFYNNVVYRQGVTDFIPVSDKLKLFSKQFKVGDVVFLYKRSKGRAEDTNKTIESCQIAIVEAYDTREVKLLRLSGCETPLTVKKRIEAMPPKVQNMYSNDYHLKMNTISGSYSWIDVGVENLLFLEEYFITDLNCNDSTRLWFEKNGEEILLELDCADAVYAILSEYNIDFNKERFKKLYFSNRVSRYITEIEK